MQFLAYLIEHNRYCNLLGIVVILCIAFLFSKNKRAISGRLIVHALLMQGILGFALLKTSIGQVVISSIAAGIEKLYQFADQGSAFLFGSLVDASQSWGFVFAFKVLPIIIFFGALMSLLFYVGIVQRCVGVISYVVRPLLGTSGAETLCAIANSFLGQTEAPLLVRHYLATMTKSELLVVMVSGMATISGAILAVFAAMGVPVVHLLTASVMAIPGSILIAKILLPETEKPITASGAQTVVESPARNMLDAISSGTSDGLQLALNVGAMLIAFISLIALLNASMEGLTALANQYILSFFNVSLPLLNLNVIFSTLFAPFGYLLGLTGKEAEQAGQLLGFKISINELVAYGEMLKMNLSDRALTLITYALCGFSNFSCIGIQIGGIGALVPERRAWLSELGLYAVLGGALSNLLSAMIVGLLI